MQKLPLISRREHNAFYNEIEEYHTLDDPAYQFLYPSDDFVTTVTDRVHQYFEALVYGDSPIMKVSTSPWHTRQSRISAGRHGEARPTNTYSTPQAH